MDGRRPAESPKERGRRSSSLRLPAPRSPRASLSRRGGRESPDSQDRGRESESERGRRPPVPAAELLGRSLPRSQGLPVEDPRLEPERAGRSVSPPSHVRSLRSRGEDEPVPRPVALDHVPRPEPELFGRPAPDPEFRGRPPAAGRSDHAPSPLRPRWPEEPFQRPWEPPEPRPPPERPAPPGPPRRPAESDRSLFTISTCPCSSVSLKNTAKPQHPRETEAPRGCLYVRRRPTLPQVPTCSTIGAERLSFRVRNGAGRFPLAMITETLWSCGRAHLSGAPDRYSGTAQWTRNIFVGNKPSAY